MMEHEARHDLPIIAIGASSGGLEASSDLLRDMPANAQAAFILILHLDPTHVSMMADLLGRHTKLKVVQATEGMALQAGVVYVIPPGVFLTIAQRILHLSEPEGGKSVRLPFDVLLRSVALDAAAQSACVILSGTGTDGSAGLADINAAGGMVIAQDPTEAGYPGMPESAIATGFVAQTLPTSQMVAALDRFLSLTPARAGPAPGAPETRLDSKSDELDQSATRFDPIISFVSDHAVQDLSLYKRGTLERRIARRMALVGLGPEETARYLAMLQFDADELAQLTADLLIHVTSFFRDPAVFNHLSAKVIRDLLGKLEPDRPLRIWTAGCSTGEEAYSLAITCLEAIEATGSQAKLQILASDVDPAAITTARVGFYSKDIEGAVSPERLARFFMPEEKGWRVNSAVRDVIMFTVADLLSDPPFSRIDLMSCRNVLIYLGPEAQKHVIARCCFALPPSGLLLLGTAEVPGQHDGCFAIEDKQARLWRHVGKSQPANLHFKFGKLKETSASPKTRVARQGLADLCRKILLEEYVPAAVLLNTQLETLYLLGPTGKYLQISKGHHDPGFAGMLPKTLRAKFREAAAACNPSNPVVTVSGGQIRGTGSFEIKLHSVTAGIEPLLLACFVDTPHLKPVASSEASAQDLQTSDLEADLEVTRSELRNALSDLEQEVEAKLIEAAEARSVNEEFQSTNEELLASKEELQSLNEELTVLNSQLHETLERHRTTANDLQNVLYSTNVATLFLDMELNIRFYTPAARAIFRVIPTDIGRPLADLAAVSRDDDLDADARSVLASSKWSERETAGPDYKWFLRRIQPYRSEGGQIEGIVITYVDITERKRANAALVTAVNEADRATKVQSRFLAAASHDLRQPLQSLALLHRLLARSKRSTEGTQLALLLDQTLNSMTAMLDSMLNVNRIESGIVQPEMQMVAIAPLMQRLADELSPLCDRKGLKLRCVPCKAFVWTDPQLLEQILRNLLSNALKYTFKGGILMGCRRRSDVLTLQVVDSGVGIADPENEAIFDAYYQGEQASGLPGYGLGLSIVQRLSRLMGHSVSVQSKLGKGSTFTITLPTVSDSSVTALPANGVPAMTEAARQTGTILLVEDDDTLRDLLAEVLDKEGHTVISRATAQEALQWASGAVLPPDLLLTDLNLRGGSSGLMLGQDLQNILGETVPTIILTGDITTETLQNISELPFKQISKPVMPEVILAQISDSMSTARHKDMQTAISAGNAKTTVHVIDDDELIRVTMRRLFEAEDWKVATYRSAEEFLAAPRPQGTVCLLVDNVLPGMEGLALVALLRAEGSHLPAVILTGHGDAAMAVAALRAGASDLIEKPAGAADLLASVRHAIQISEEGEARTQSLKDAKFRFSALSPREHAVLERVLSGVPNKIIAYELGINQRTVENHRAAVMRKTGASSLPELIRLAIAAVA